MSENDLQVDPDSPVEPAAKVKPQRDGWDKAEISFKIIAAFLTPIIIAVIGIWGQRTITRLSIDEQNARTQLSNQEQKARTQLSIQEQNARLYTELLSRREEAESSLRKDMFKEVMSGFFTEIEAKGKSKDQVLVEGNVYKGEDIKNRLSKKILKLEMLALNFGDSLSIGPLFSELSSDIEQVLMANRDSIDDWKTVAAPYQKRLRSLAKRVASRQISTISAGSGSSDKYEFKLSVNTNRVRPDEDEDAENKVFYWNSMDVIEEDKLKLDGVSRFFEITLSDANLESYTISVNIKILEIPRNESSTGIPRVVADRNFNMDFFNFPLIDNTRLSNNHRFALIIEDFDIRTIELKGILFPGVFASQRDKPFLNEAINELKANKFINQDSATAQVETDSPGVNNDAENNRE